MSKSRDWYDGYDVYVRPLGAAAPKRTHRNVLLSTAKQIAETVWDMDRFAKIAIVPAGEAEVWR